MRLTIALVILFNLSAFQGILNAQKMVKFTDYTMTIEGTSSLHDWVSEVEKVEGKAILIEENEKLTDITSLELKIEVEGIQSGKGIMDKKTYKALDSENHPYITFKAENLKTITPSTMEVSGKLTIAGKTNTIDLTVAYTYANGTLTANGKIPLKMTDFGIAPPKAMMGTLKTGDDITIVYNVTLK